MDTKEHLQNFVFAFKILLIMIFLSLYVDDMLVVGKDKSKIDRLKKEFSKSFDMKDLGPAQYILAIRSLMIGRRRSCVYYKKVILSVFLRSSI